MSLDRIAMQRVLFLRLPFKRTGSPLNILSSFIFSSLMLQIELSSLVGSSTTSLLGALFIYYSLSSTCINLLFFILLFITLILPIFYSGIFQFFFNREIFFCVIILYFK